MSADVPRKQNSELSEAGSCWRLRRCAMCPGKESDAQADALYRQRGDTRILESVWTTAMRMPIFEP